MHGGVSTILKTSKKWYEVMFLICKSVHSEVKHKWDKTQMFKTFLLDKINGTKKAHFFLSRFSADHSFTFNLRFFYQLKQKIRLSKNVCEIFHSRFRFIFIKDFFFSTKCMDSLTLKRHKSFQN